MRDISFLLTQLSYIYFLCNERDAHWGLWGRGGEGSFPCYLLAVRCSCSPWVGLSTQYPRDGLHLLMMSTTDGVALQRHRLFKSNISSNLAERGSRFVSSKETTSSSCPVLGVLLQKNWLQIFWEGFWFLFCFDLVWLVWFKECFPCS